MAVKVLIPNLKKVRAALRVAKGKLDDLNPVAKDATLYLLSLVQKRFRSGDPDAAKWKPLSATTLFIRRHRAQAPNKTALPLNDKGLLRNSTFPFTRQAGSEFGVVNSLKYAGLQNFGGMSQGGEVLIRNFARRTKTGGLSKVIKRFYTMKIKPSHVPARPFFPEEDQYMPGIRRIMGLHIKGALGGMQ